MKKTLAMMAIVLSFGLTAALDAEAKRLGGGKSVGTQRQSVTAPAGGTASPGTAAPVAGSAANAAPAAGATAAAAAGAAGKRSWMGPVAGIAAGLGIAALASHFGFGEALANMLTVALLVMAVLVVIGFVMRKRMAGQGALAGAGGAGGLGRSGGLEREPHTQQAAYRAPLASGASLIGSRMGGGLSGPGVGAGTAGQIPQGFDTAAFERGARDQFRALQAANDAGDLTRLREYLSTEMFDGVRAEIAERGGAAQATEVFGLEVKVVNVAEEADQYVASVRFTGSIREQFGTQPEDLDEVWHLVKPTSGPGGWVIAGIQQA